MHEAKLNAILVKSLKKQFGDDIDVSKRHGDMFSAFYPDVEACLYGNAYYFEGKIAVVPKRAGTPIRLKHKLSEGQKKKLAELSRAGGYVHLALYFFDEHGKYCLFVEAGSELFEEIVETQGFKQRKFPIAGSFVVPYKKQLFEFSREHVRKLTWRLE